MNYIGFNQDGGFRLTTNILNAVQAAYSLFNALGFIAGDKTIITGCVVTGNNVSDGVVFLNGQVYNFKGGNLGTNVIVKETITSYPFQNGTVKPVLYDRFVGFGSGLPEETYLWADFKRTFQTKDIQAFKDEHNERITNLEGKQAFAIGMIIRYDQPLNVPPPAGWIDWNPDTEQGRVWVARSTTDSDFGLGVPFGSKTHTLSISEMPSHNHDSEINSSGDDVDSDGNGSAIVTSWREITGINRKNVVRIKNNGSGQSHNNVQPSIGVRFIKYVGIQN